MKTRLCFTGQLILIAWSGVSCSDCESNEGCTSDLQYCASGECLDLGSCRSVIDCHNPSNIFPRFKCVGYLECETGKCATRCTGSFCSDGSQQVNCFVAPCESPCVGSISCVDDYCGGCNSFHFDLAGNNICPTSPTTTATSDPCFSSAGTVEVQGKGQITMKYLEVGDLVLTPFGFEKVYTIDHRSENKPTDFVQIYTELEQPLEVTGNHLIYLQGRNDPFKAGTVVVGDRLQAVIEGKMGSVVVEKVSSISRNG